MSTAKSKSLFIMSVTSKYWLRIYRRGGRYFALANFTPSAFPSFIDDIEKTVQLQQISNYTDTSMGVFVFTCQKGLPVVNLNNILNKVENQEPKEVIHGQTKQQELDS